MRILPIITAVLVMAALYLLVFERQDILNFATGEDPVQDTEMLETAGETLPAERPTSLVSVVAIASSARNIDSAVIVRGRTEAARQVELRAETTGQVVSEPLRKGTDVELGQMLCQLDPGTREVSLADANARLIEANARIPEAESHIPEALARLAEAEARLIEADIILRTATGLSQDGFASETRVATAQAARESALAAVQSAKSGVAAANSGLLAASAGIQSAQAGIAAAQKEIDRLTLTAPFSGLLESDTAELGSLLQPGALCATIIQLDPIKLVGFIPETSVSKVKVGAQAGARLATGQEISGRVTFLSRSADPTTRTFRVEIQVPNTDFSIRDGQTAEIVIASDGQSAHLLPMSALTLDDDGLLGVRTVDDASRVQFSAVEVVRDTVDGIWVTGLADAADVIIVGQEFVISGVHVDVAFQDPQQ